MEYWPPLRDGSSDQLDRELAKKYDYWEELAREVRAAVDSFPAKLLNNKDLTRQPETLSGKRVRVFELGKFRRIEHELNYTALLVGISEDESRRKLYEYGPPRQTLDDNGDPREQIIGLYELSFDVLTPEELIQAQTLLQQHMS